MFIKSHIRIKLKALYYLMKNSKDELDFKNTELVSLLTDQELNDFNSLDLDDDEIDEINEMIFDENDIENINTITHKKYKQDVMEF